MANELDQLLLYARTRSEDAFAELVQRYLPLVYASALRRVGGDAHRAEDVTQMVFVALARNASSLSRHPNLTGWLFTTTRFLAAKTLRTERRRQTREQEAEMIAPEPSSLADAASEPLIALLDDLVADLKELDREVILRRFHRGLRLAEIGREMGVSENAVQKRLDRALEQLKEKFSRRGVVSTTAAVALALEVQGAITVPAGLAAAATGAALTGGTAGPLAGSGLALLTKFQVAAALAALLAGGAALVWQRSENRRLGGELQQQEIALRREISLQALRADRAEADALSWRKTAEAAQAGRPEPEVRLLDPRQFALEVINRATQLQHDDKPAEALGEYLKGYRILKGVKPGGLDPETLMPAMANLGKSYPPALAAMRELRDTAMRQIQEVQGRQVAGQDPNNVGALASEFAMLNQQLGENEVTVQLYDSLPPDVRILQTLAQIGRAGFVAAQHYDAVMRFTTFGGMLSGMESRIKTVTTPGGRLQGNPGLIQDVIQSTAESIEILAGAGRPQDARALAEKLLAFDNSESTRVIIRQHLDRAGQSSLPLPP
jgi:RNA polymerase sigma factor (sigma-70 family)